MQFASIMLMVRNPREKHRLLLYLPAMVFYTGYYLRIVRTIAHYKEFFHKESYDDPWNPLKSSLKAKHSGSSTFHCRGLVRSDQKSPI
jgi:hypothetical protein